MPKVLISDKLSGQAVEIFRSRWIEVDFQPELGRDPPQLAAVLGPYDGLPVAQSRAPALTRAVGAPARIASGWGPIARPPTHTTHRNRLPATNCSSTPPTC